MTERTPIAPVPQLKRQSAIPQPPPRRPRVVNDEATNGTAGNPPRLVTSTPAPRTQKSTGPKGPAPVNARGVVRPISLSVPADLLAKLRQFAKRTETSYADLLMDAIAARRDNLHALVEATQPETTSDGLFVRENHAPAPTLSTLSVRMLAVNVEAIDKLVASVGAQSRSQLCVAALTSYLSHR